VLLGVGLSYYGQFGGRGMIPVFFNRKMLNDPTDLIYFISSCIDRWVILQKKKTSKKDGGGRKQNPPKGGQVRRSDAF
jgi:hypothetical protein